MTSPDLDAIRARHTECHVKLRHMRPGEDYTVCDLCKQYWPCDAMQLLEFAEAVAVRVSS